MSKMKLQSLAYCFFFLLLTPLFLFGQRKSYVKTGHCRQIIALDLGAHHISTYDTYGANIGFSFENIIQNNLTMIVGFKEFADKSGIFTYDLAKNPLKEFIAHRLSFFTGLNFYPKTSFHGFYIGSTFGGMIVLNTNGDQPLVYTKGVPKLTPAFETMADVKLGFQRITKYGFTWNVYAGAGLIFPSKQASNPFGEVGVKLGKKL
jgi:hypothetical protein